MRWWTARVIRAALKYPLYERAGYIRNKKSLDMALYIRARCELARRENCFSPRHAINTTRKEMEYHRRLHLESQKTALEGAALETQ